MGKLIDHARNVEILRFIIRNILGSVKDYLIYYTDSSENSTIECENEEILCNFNNTEDMIFFSTFYRALENFISKQLKLISTKPRLIMYEYINQIKLNPQKVFSNIFTIVDNNNSIELVLRNSDSIHINNDMNTLITDERFIDIVEHNMFNNIITHDICYQINENLGINFMLANLTQV